MFISLSLYKGVSGTGSVRSGTCKQSGQARNRQRAGHQRWASLRAVMLGQLASPAQAKEGEEEFDDDLHGHSPA